jgi:hypothetical protein
LLSKKIFSETARPNESKLGRKHPWKVPYKDCSFSSDPFTNMEPITTWQVTLIFINPESFALVSA